MSNNVRILEEIDPLTGEVSQHVIITNADGSFTGMTKEHYDNLEAAKKASGTLS
jgi:hypothetical protein